MQCGILCWILKQENFCGKKKLLTFELGPQFTEQHHTKVKFLVLIIGLLTPLSTLLQALPPPAEEKSKKFKGPTPFSSLSLHSSLFLFLRTRHLKSRTFKNNYMYEGIYKVTAHTQGKTQASKKSPQRSLNLYLRLPRHRRSLQQPKNKNKNQQTWRRERI